MGMRYATATAGVGLSWALMVALSGVAEAVVYGTADIPQRSFDALMADSRAHIRAAANATWDCAFVAVPIPTTLQRIPIALQQELVGLPGLDYYVTTNENAVTACYLDWRCTAVQTFRLPGQSGLAALYYGDNGLSGGSLVTAVARGVPATLTGGTIDVTRWVATFVYDRIAGYACPAHLRVQVDVLFLWRTYAFQLGGDLVDPSVVPVIGGLDATDEQILAREAELVTYYHKYGAQKGLWPNSGCARTPFLYDPSTGCAREACPAFTLCPAGYRTYLSAWNMCALSTQTGPQLTVPGEPQSFDVRTGIAVWQHPYAPNTTLIVNLAANPRTQLTDARLACSQRWPMDGGWGAGSDTPSFCGHDLAAVLRAASAGSAFDVPIPAVCSCGNVVIPVDGDPACQLDAQNSVCMDAASGLSCSGSTHGSCIYDIANVGWYTIQTLDSSTVLRCRCTGAWTGLTCATSKCAVSDPDTSGGALLDCAASGRGVCAETIDGADDWHCVCVSPYFGPQCQYTDAQSLLPGHSPDAPAVMRYACYVPGSRVEHPPLDMSDSALYECSGRGVCVLDGDDAGCVCDIGYTGPRCEFLACTHGIDCGPYGGCGRDIDTSGRATTSCICAVFAEDSRTALATTASGSKQCVTPLCDKGNLTIVQWPTPGDVNRPPQGICSCLRLDLGVSSRSDLIQLTTRTTPSGTQYVFPVHAFLPTIELSPATPGGVPVALVATLRIQNIGVTCQLPVCPVAVHPIDGTPLDMYTSCGVPTSITSQVCLPCDMWPDYTLCSQTTNFGGACDCTGTAVADLLETVPYWQLTGQPRYKASSNAANPLCVPYCENGGRWDAANGVCNCRGTPFWGDTCTVPRCTHGTPAFDGSVPCIACDPGRRLGVASDCGDCEDAYTGAACDQCADGYYREAGDGVEGPCVSCAAAAAATCNLMGTADIGCTPTGPVCICTERFTGTRCDACKPGLFSGATALTEGMCLTCAEMLGCQGAHTAHASCDVSQPWLGRCECIDAHRDARCASCATGYLQVANGSCVACAVALGCNPRGTLTSKCPSANPAASTCTCNTGAGYTGTTCNACRKGWAKSALDPTLCVPCGGGASPCGPFGVQTCAAGISKCDCTHGLSGGACEVCLPDACGGIQRGTCQTTDTSPSARWCTCINGWAPDLTRATPSKPWFALPCTVCNSTTHFISTTNPGVCTPFSGCDSGTALAAVDVEATRTLGRCVCAAGFNPSASPCGACLPGSGRAGPRCEACSPACAPGGGTCVYNTHTRAPECRCLSTRTGLSCDRCVDGTVGPACAACPVGGCGDQGTCAWNGANGRAVCVCNGGSRHTDATDPTSPCHGCAAGQSPMSCSSCPLCPSGTTCVETLYGVVSCACLPGYRRLNTTVSLALDNTAAVCFPSVTATLLEQALDAGALSLLAQGIANGTEQHVVIPPTLDISQGDGATVASAIWLHIGILLACIVAGGAVVFVVSRKLHSN